MCNRIFHFQEEQRVSQQEPFFTYFCKFETKNFSEKHCQLNSFSIKKFMEQLFFKISSFRDIPENELCAIHIRIIKVFFFEIWSIQCSKFLYSAPNFYENMQLVLGLFIYLEANSQEWDIVFIATITLKHHGL